MRDRIMEVIRENSDTDQINPATKVSDVCDSLDMLNIMWELEEEFGREFDETEVATFTDKSVGEFVEYAVQKIATPP